MNSARRFATVLAVAAASLAGASAASAATLVVDDVPFGGAIDCVTSYHTIQAAVNAATAGDTIKVCAGTYAPVDSHKSLTFLGPKAGVDARTGRTTTAGEAVIVAPTNWNPVQFSGDRVVIDGFWIQSPTTGNFGITMGVSEAGVATVRNNVIRAANGVHQIGGRPMFSRNRFERLTTGPTNAIGIEATRFGQVTENLIGRGFSIGIDVEKWGIYPGFGVASDSNRIYSNSIGASVPCQDDTVGSGTNGTANTWLDNFVVFSVAGSPCE